MVFFYSQKILKICYVFTFNFLGFPACYVSGGAISAASGVPDIGFFFLIFGYKII